jgi:threonine aldolase
MVGGNLRQAGPLAAAGLLGLETMVDRLAEDHRTAQRLAQGLHKADARFVNPAEVETNLVRVDVSASGRPAAEWSAAMHQRGVRVNPCAKFALRFVTHRHIGDADVDQAVRAMTETLKQFVAAK